VKYFMTSANTTAGTAETQSTSVCSRPPATTATRDRLRRVVTQKRTGGLWLRYAPRDPLPDLSEGCTSGY
jgi:hypothetical protein